VLHRLLVQQLHLQLQLQRVLPKSFGVLHHLSNLVPDLLCRLP
jgi:hypothetical protein